MSSTGPCELANDPLRILHVARNPDTGVATVMSSLSQAQKSRGHDVSIAVLRSSEWTPLRQLRELAFQSHWSPKVFGTAAFAFHAASRSKEPWSRDVLLLPRPLVIHYHNAWLAGALMFTKAIPGVVQVVTYHGLASEAALNRQPLRRAIHAHWARKVEKHADAVVSVDAVTPVTASKLFGVSPENFVLIPNGTPALDSTALNDRKVPPRRKSDLVVAHVGSIDEGKGWRITAEAVERVRRLGISVSLIIAGIGPQAEEASNWCIERDRYCTYLGWVDNVPENVLAEADILSMPSRTEGMPMAALEAVSMGIPLVCTPVGGLPEVARHQREGFLVERTPEAFAKAFAVLGRDENLRLNMAQNARKRWGQCFTDEIMQSRYEELYSNSMAVRHFAA